LAYSHWPSRIGPAASLPTSLPCGLSLSICLVTRRPCCLTLVLYCTKSVVHCVLLWSCLLLFCIDQGPCCLN